MSKNFDKVRLLEKLKRLCGQGLAENEPEEEAPFLKNFLPIQAHFRMLDPDVRLVIGDKGAGKTHLFRALEIAGGRQALLELAAKKGLPIPPLEKTKWLVGYQTSGINFPPAGVIDEFARHKDPPELQNIWLAILLQVLAHAEEIEKNALPDIFHRTTISRIWDLEAINQQTSKNLSSLFAILDGLEISLQKHERFAFVAYDELDRLSPGDWDTLTKILRGLVQFWAAYGRRWRRLRPKLFLRRDLYQRAALFGPDIAKIAANRAELLWQSHELYAMLFKRLLNDDEFHEYLNRYAMLYQEEGVLGRIPQATEENGYNVPVTMLFGKYMGPSPTKGLTLRWIPNHIKDGHGRIYPRPFLRMVEEAAELELRDNRARTQEQLIHHTALRGALDRVSEFRVLELAQEEFPWLAKIRKRFEGMNLHVPAERKPFLRALNIKWDKEDGYARPPDDNPEALLDYLVELGILTLRSDGRIDVGDLYLRGFHLKRKGGVRRPRESVQS
ncbi:hypothetical protein HUU40_24975 [candidate division KSB1 bacterium]|nr:hypothetical protein [candidate division KSB1 bacterium]